MPVSTVRLNFNLYVLFDLSIRIFLSLILKLILQYTFLKISSIHSPAWRSYILLAEIQSLDNLHFHPWTRNVLKLMHTDKSVWASVLMGGPFIYSSLFWVGVSQWIVARSTSSRCSERIFHSPFNSTLLILLVREESNYLHDPNNRHCLFSVIHLGLYL